MAGKAIGALVLATALGATALGATTLPARAGDPDFIFSENTKFHLLTPDAKLSTYAIDDPVVAGVACWYTLPEKGGLKGMFGVANETSDVSLACRQYGPISFKDKFAEGDEVFAQRRSFFFKHMQIVRGCDAKRNVLVYMVYTDKLIDGSPKNSTSTVPVMPWGGSTETPRCGDFLKG